MTNKLQWCIFTALLSTQLVISVIAQEPPDHITVSGTATTEVTPDVMNWNLQVKSQEQNLEKLDFPIEHPEQYFLYCNNQSTYS